MITTTGLSIRWRLTIWNVLAFATILVAFGLGVYLQLRQTHFQMLDKALHQRSQSLVVLLESGMPAELAISEWISKFGEHGEYFAFVRNDRQQTVGANQGVTDDNIERLQPQLIQGERGTLHDERFGRMRYASREFVLQDQSYRLYILAELEHLDEELSLVRKTFFWSIPPALFLSAALSYWLAVRALSPVEQPRRNTDSITATDLHQRLSIANEQDEIGQLTQTINSLFARLEQAFDEIKRFSADASHELRTPIAIIRSEAELCLQHVEGGSRTAERLQSILEECTRLTELTSQLLALSRAESHIHQASSGTVCVNSLLVDVIDSFETLSEKAQVAIHFTGADPTCEVRGDYESLRQLFHNLIDNAIKYNVPGGAIEVRCQSEHHGVTIDVQDTGIGISSEDLPRIFERFFRSRGQKRGPDRPTTDAMDQGSGLGLSIVQRIVANHGGTCEVQSQPDQGTRFRVRLPTQ